MFSLSRLCVMYVETLTGVLFWSSDLLGNIFALFFFHLRPSPDHYFCEFSFGADIITDPPGVLEDCDRVREADPRVDRQRLGARVAAPLRVRVGVHEHESSSRARRARQRDAGSRVFVRYIECGRLSSLDRSRRNLLARAALRYFASSFCAYEFALKRYRGWQAVLIYGVL